MQTLRAAAFLGAIVLLPVGTLMIVLGLRRPRPAGRDLDSMIGMPVPHPVSRMVSADHRSTPAERQECRVRLGSSYDAHLVVVADNLAQRPAALRGITMEANDLPIDDLVTVSTYLHGPPTGLDRALRNGAAEPHRAVIACLASGLRRFPYHYGACYGVARRVGVPLDVYVPGRTIIEPAFIRTDTHWPAGRFTGASTDDTEIVFAFWSRTGREVGALGADSNTVIFTAGTSFRVLGVRPSVAGQGPAVVFLGEVPAGTGANRARSMIGQRRVLAQLQRQMIPRAGEAVQAETVGPDLSPLVELRFTPGFDETGRPYREEPAPVPHQP